MRCTAILALAAALRRDNRPCRADSIKRHRRAISQKLRFASGIADIVAINGQPVRGLSPFAPALTLEGYELPDGTGALSVTGGIGGFFGASGDVQFPPGVTLGTNVTGYPNFRAKFRIRRGTD